MSRKRSLRVGWPAAVASLAAVVLLAPGAAPATGADGTCLASPALPCSATAGQTYDGVTLGADSPGSNDSEAAVEAVLGHVLGSPTDVSPLATSLTGDSGDFDFAPDSLTSGQRFEWSYRGDAAPAYLSVKAGDAFALIGVAGTTNGSVDVAGLLGGHDISHVGFWSSRVAPIEPVAARRLHGEGLVGNARLAKIEGGKVPCVHSETEQITRCAFSKRGKGSGSWLESPEGGFAKIGQTISLNGKPGGDYAIITPLNRDGTVPAIEPSGRDAAGAYVDTPLANSCFIETFGSATQASQRRTGDAFTYQNDNHATRVVPATTNPDGAPYAKPPENGVLYLTGEGAALNDINGTERYPPSWGGGYMPDPDPSTSGSERCHVAWTSGYEQIAAKRPATSYGVVKPSPIVWRPVSSGSIAN